MLMELEAECNYRFNELAQFGECFWQIQLFSTCTQINLIKLSGYQINNAI